MPNAHSDKIQAFILEKAASFAEQKVEPLQRPFWQGLAKVGTELWLDTGDIDAAAKLWNASFCGLTTNNTLLNAEIQKGIYDNLIAEAGKMLASLDEQSRIAEIAFILNALHGLRLANRFGAKVSVELHTEFAYDADTTVAYAQRFYAICPQSFIIKIPLTQAGLIATRAVREKGIPVNFTLGFSARQNYIAALFAKPSYVNVFLGRLNSYIADNGLGDGKLIGEKATLASQKAITEASEANREPTRQIAASMRDANQVADLCGVDVYTMPVKVADAAQNQLDGSWTTKRDADYQVSLGDGIDRKELGIEKLWTITDKERAFAQSIEHDVPASAYDLTERLYAMEIEDIFPRMMSNEIWVLANQGKIPKHETWAPRIAQQDLAIDSLLNLAALESFTADQKALDTRIGRLLG